MPTSCAGGCGLLEVAFGRSQDARTGGPRCRGRQRRRQVLRWMWALTCRTGDWRMVPPDLQGVDPVELPRSCTPSGWAWDQLAGSVPECPILTACDFTVQVG